MEWNQIIGHIIAGIVWCMPLTLIWGLYYYCKGISKVEKGNQSEDFIYNDFD